MISKCKVKLQEEEKEANLYGIYQHSHVKQAILIGEMGGVVAYPVAVVDWGEGLREIPLNTVIEVRENKMVIQGVTPDSLVTQLKLDNVNLTKSILRSAR